MKSCLSTCPFHPEDAVFILAQSAAIPLVDVKVPVAPINILIITEPGSGLHHHHVGPLSAVCCPGCGTEGLFDGSIANKLHLANSACRSSARTC